MLEIPSLVGSTAIGAAIKIIAGLLQNWSDSALERRKQLHEQRMAELNKAIQWHEITDNPSVRVTRRVLAFSVCWTFCLIALYCAAFPDIPLLVVPTDPAKPTEISWLWGFYTRTIQPTVEPFLITTGTMAYASIHLCATVLGFYFTPIGRK